MVKRRVDSIQEMNKRKTNEQLTKENAELREKLAALEEILYGKDPATEGGTDGTDSRLPLPAEIIELMKDSAISG